MEELLAGLESAGANKGRGSFGLDPKRALELLRDQGRLGVNAPLFLLRNLYEHTNGAQLTWKKTLFSHQIQWDSKLGIPPQDIYRSLAEGAFASASISLKFEPGTAYLSNKDSISAPFSVRFQETFGKAEERLRNYPITGLFEPEEPATPWLSEVTENGILRVRPLGVSTPRISWVICGITFDEPLRMPVLAQITDDKLPCDITLTSVRSSERKTHWLETLRQVLHGHLLSVLDSAPEIKLDHNPLPEETERLLSLLPYVLSLEEGERLRPEMKRKVQFRDVFGEYWTLQRLLECQEEQGEVLIVPAVPTHCPEEAAGSRPVLLWRGETKRYGAGVFQHLRSGAGYLYSLRHGSSSDTEISHDNELARVEWRLGELALRPFGDKESACEVEMRGRRRAPEKNYLGAPAPLGLRLLWESNQEVAHWDRSEEFEREFSAVVVDLVDQVAPGLELAPSWLQTLLVWARGLASLEEYENLRAEPLFETVDSRWVSWDDVQDFQAREGRVMILRDLSTSIPDAVPFSLVLWDHPLLHRFPFELADVGSAVRRAFYKEQGRRKWLRRYEPTEIEQWPDLKGAELQNLEGDHILVRLDDDDPSSLVIWREGRPLGRIRLRSERFPPGYILIHRDDEFPADDYWSGPDPEALTQLDSWVESCRDML